MLDTHTFISILTLEREELLTVSIHLPADVREEFEGRLNDAFRSDTFSDKATAWNAERKQVIAEAMELHLLPAGAKFAREWLREETEDNLALKCADTLRGVRQLHSLFRSSHLLLNINLQRINFAPYVTPELKEGDTCSVLAVSWGKGDPKTDAVALVFLDEAGRLREHSHVDNLLDKENEDEFVDIIKRRQPDVIVIGGFSMSSAKLRARVRQIVSGGSHDPTAAYLGQAPPPPPANTEDFKIPVEWVHDEVARIYQNSKRATDEFSALSPLQRYCIGLARYAQGPVNEYAALGSDLLAISFKEDYQHMVSTASVYFG